MTAELDLHLAMTVAVSDHLDPTKRGFITTMHISLLIAKHADSAKCYFLPSSITPYVFAYRYQLTAAFLASRLTHSYVLPTCLVYAHFI